MGSFAPSWAELPVGGMAKRGTMTVERREWRGGERGVALGDRWGGGLWRVVCAAVAGGGLDKKLVELARYESTLIGLVFF